MNNLIVAIVLTVIAIAVAVMACWPKKKSEVTREPLKTANLSLDGPGADREQ